MISSMYKVSCYILLFILSGGLYAQELVAENLSDALKYIDQQYGTNQVLVNGEYAANNYRNDIGSPFLKSIDFQEGSVVLHGIRYNNLQLRYNVFEQHIEILHENNIGEQLVFIPSSVFISEFEINDEHFAKINTANKSSQFYQVVYQNEIACLYSWKKNRSDSYHNVSFSAFKYSDNIRRSYLLIGDELHKYKGNRSFVKIFPDEIQKVISQYLKTQNIKMKSASTDKVAAVVEYCEQVMNNNGSK